MPIINTRKPIISLTEYDTDGNELTSTIEVELDSDSDTVELWQYLRQQADKWIAKKYKK